MMAWMRYARGLRVFMWVLAGMLSATCPAADLPQDWETECIGRYQISLPEDVEMALTTRKEVLEGQTIYPFLFEDGSSAGHSSFYYLGRIGITTTTSLADFEKLRVEVARRVKDRKKQLISEGEKDIANAIVPFPVNAPHAFAWRSLRSINLHLYAAGRIYNYRSSSFDNFSENRAYLDSFLKNFRPRQIFEIPKEQGICFPYSFLANNSTDFRNIGVTLRLKDHPDVEIFFRDETSSKPLGEGFANRNAKEEIDFFWRFMNQGLIKKVRYSWPQYRSVKLDNREGEYTFVQITRPDDSQDFGYLAYVKGDPEAATDTPNLMLYVIRTAARAKGKPVSESELKDIAQKIAASVKRHH